MFGRAGESAKSILEGLNQEQRVAVTHEGGPLLALAGAGTGKTTTLVSRLAWLVETGVPSDRILLLTFSRRAAREMIGRARALIGPQAAGQVVGGTFHSVAYRLIASHAAALGLPPRFGVLDASDAADLLDLLREELGLASGTHRVPQKATLLDIYSRCVNAQQALTQVLAERFPWCEDHLDSLRDLFSAYEQRKRKLSRLDLDDLLVYWQALAGHDVIGRKLGAQYTHLLVDEYQDLNGLQTAILRDLRREQRGLTAVGDDAQAIYSFRSASAEHILRFTEDFPDATVVTLERNYRSTRPILDLANEVWTSAIRSYPKQLRTDREDGSPPQIVYCQDDTQQASEVCDRVLALHEEGTPLREQAVLMRAGRHSNDLELELARRKIPFVKYGGISYLEAAHVKDFVCTLRIADDPSDQLSWFRILRLPPGVGPVSARRALDALDIATLTDPVALCSRWRDNVEPLLKAPARQACAPLIAALAETGSEQRVGVIAERICEALKPLIKAHYPDWHVRLPDLDTITNAAANATSLGSFLADLALDPPTSSADYAKPPHLDDDYLVLSTVHSAKGLEWDAVHIISASDGNFPSDMALSNPEGLEEERRLFYVALTRARNTLGIYVPTRYYHHPNGRDDTHGYGKQSRFLTEQAEQLCERVNFNSQSADITAQACITSNTRMVQIDLVHLWR